ncbi:MAG: M20 family metallopeptidase [Bacillota bacterium]|nr:M20 family metallopeptidase [Bacillota bacterium]
MDLKSAVLKRMDEIKGLRKLLHENAELAFNEYKTRDIIIKYLESLGLQCHDCAKTGVASIMNDGEECTAVRADMDALPINGVFHGCGHDYHMAVVLGTAAVLKDLGVEECIKFIFQPAEEATGGAVPMIKDGVLENPKVKNIIGCHVWPDLEVGCIEAAPGASMGSVDDFIVKYKGRGGHAAMPELCLNPLKPSVRFAEAVNAMSEDIFNPNNPHILTVTSLNCGTAPNVIADSAVVMGTVRTFDVELRKTLKDKILNLASSFADSSGCTVDPFYDEQYPPLINDKELTEKFISSTSELLGSEKVLPLKPSFAAEDFSYFAEAIPAVHFRLGITGEGKGKYPLHSPHFDADEDALFYGIYAITNFILQGDF